MSEPLHRYAYLCIGCPLGCRLELDVVETPGGQLVEIVEVRGNSCRKGDEFAREEHVDPRRTVTTTVAIEGARWPRLPVRTTGTVPKARVRDVCAALRSVRVHAPVRIGDMVLPNVLGLGVDVVATGTANGTADTADGNDALSRAVG